jgi:hypothetical protein
MLEILQIIVFSCWKNRTDIIAEEEYRVVGENFDQQGTNNSPAMGNISDDNNNLYFTSPTAPKLVPQLHSKKLQEDRSFYL